MATEETIEFVSAWTWARRTNSRPFAVLEKRSPEGEFNRHLAFTRFAILSVPNRTLYSAIFERISMLFSVNGSAENTLVVIRRGGRPSHAISPASQSAGRPNGRRDHQRTGSDAEGGVWLAPRRICSAPFRSCSRSSGSRPQAASDVPTLVQELLHFQMKPTPPPADRSLLGAKARRTTCFTPIAIAAGGLSGRGVSLSSGSGARLAASEMQMNQSRTSTWPARRQSST